MIVSLDNKIAQLYLLPYSLTTTTFSILLRFTPTFVMGQPVGSSGESANRHP